MIFSLGIAVGMVIYHLLYTKVSSYKNFITEIETMVISLFKK